MKRKPTYKQILLATQAAHESAYYCRGDRYATADEMTYIRNDPLAYLEQVCQAVCATFQIDRDALLSIIHKTPYFKR